MAGIPAALNGQIFHEIEFQPAVEAVNWSIEHDPPLNARFGFAGGIGISKGQAPVLVNLTFATVAEKDQFNLLALAAQTRNTDPKNPGFTYTWWEGDPGISRRWQIHNCQAGGFRQGNDPAAGTGDRQIRIMGLAPKQIQ